MCFEKTVNFYFKMWFDRTDKIKFPILQLKLFQSLKEHFGIFLFSSKPPDRQHDIFFFGKRFRNNPQAAPQALIESIGSKDQFISKS